jgi:hypothetical protein
MRRCLLLLSVFVPLPFLANASAAERPTAGVKLDLPPRVELGCSSVAKSNQFSRNHQLKNTSGFTLRAGRVLHWRASDGGSGKLTLSADLPENASVTVKQVGNTAGYSCKAHFLPGPPDLGAAKVERKSANVALVWIGNFNPWVAAPATKLRVRALRCATTVIREVVVDAPALAARDAKWVEVPLQNDDADYLQATVNVDGKVADPNPLNDTAVSAEYGTAPGCTSRSR